MHATHCASARQEDRRPWFGDDGTYREEHSGGPDTRGIQSPRLGLPALLSTASSRLFYTFLCCHLNSCCSGHGTREEGGRHSSVWCTATGGAAHLEEGVTCRGVGRRAGGRTRGDRACLPSHDSSTCLSGRQCRRFSCDARGKPAAGLAIKFRSFPDKCNRTIQTRGAMLRRERAANVGLLL